MSIIPVSLMIRNHEKRDEIMNILMYYYLLIIILRNEAYKKLMVK